MAAEPRRDALLEADAVDVLYGDYQILWGARLRVEPGEDVVHALRDLLGADAVRFVKVG